MKNTCLCMIGFACVALTLTIPHSDSLAPEGPSRGVTDEVSPKIITDEVLRDILDSDLTIEKDARTIASVFYGGLFRSRNDFDRTPGCQWSCERSGCRLQASTQSANCRLPTDNDQCCAAVKEWHLPSVLTAGSIEYRVLQFPPILNQGILRLVRCVRRNCNRSCVPGFTYATFLVQNPSGGLQLRAFRVPTYCRCTGTRPPRRILPDETGNTQD